MSDLYQLRENMNQFFDKLEEHEKRLTDQAKMIEEQGQRISALEKNASTCTRNQKIVKAIRKGERTKDVAARFGITPSRVAQIAPRKFN